MFRICESQRFDIFAIIQISFARRKSARARACSCVWRIFLHAPHQQVTWAYLRRILAYQLAMVLPSSRKATQKKEEGKGGKKEEGPGGGGVSRLESPDIQIADLSFIGE